MTNEQIAEKVLEDVFKRLAADRPQDLIPVYIFSQVTANVVSQVLSKEKIQAMNRQVAIISRICDEKVQARQKKSQSFITPNTLKG